LWLIGKLQEKSESCPKLWDLENYSLFSGKYPTYATLLSEILAKYSETTRDTIVEFFKGLTLKKKERQPFNYNVSHVDDFSLVKSALEFSFVTGKNYNIVNFQIFKHE
jgi:hypothetical protein